MDIVKNRHHQAGFTLIELLVVISIISLLSSIILTALYSARLKAEDSARVQTLQQLRNAFELFHTDKGCYPNGDAACDGGNFGDYYPIDSNITTLLTDHVISYDYQCGTDCFRLGVKMKSNPQVCWYNDTRGTGWGIPVDLAGPDTSSFHHYFDCKPNP